MNRKNWLILALVVLGTGLGYLVHDFVRNYLVIPVLTVFTRISFVMGLYWRSQDQELIWVAFLLVTFLLAAASIKRLWVPGPGSGSRGRVNSGRLEFWKTKLGSISEGTYQQWRFTQEIGKILLEQIALDQGVGKKTVQNQIENDQITLPPDIKNFLQIAYTKKLHEYYQFQRQRTDPHRLPFVTPERIIAYLENSLD